MSCNCGTNTPKPSIFNAMGIGKLERRNPVPPGIYWTDLIGAQSIAVFAAWLAEHAPMVQLLNHEEHPELPFWECPVGTQCPARAWVKFQVVIATPWNTALGFPTIVEPGQTINSSADTITNPDFSDNCDIACQAKWVVGGVAAIALGAVVLSRAIR